MTGPKTNEREGTRAVLRHSRISPYKVRVVLDLIRGKTVQEARDILRFSERDAAIAVGKLLDSAVANAENNDRLDGDELFVSACYADEGVTLKRFRPRARGRAGRIRKRGSHITIIVSRLPEDKLARLRAKREADVANRRARRVASSRGDRAARRDEQAPGTTETLSAEAAQQIEAAAEVGEAAEEAGAVDQQAAGAAEIVDDVVVEDEAPAVEDEAPAAEDEAPAAAEAEKEEN